MFMVIFSLFFLVCLSSLVFLILLRKLRSSKNEFSDVEISKNGGKGDEEVKNLVDSPDNLERDLPIEEEICKQDSESVYETVQSKNVYENIKDNVKNDDGELCDMRLSVFINYLNRNYWKNSLHPVTNGYTRDNLKPVMRLSKSRRKIHIVYSKNTLMKLAFSSNLNRGVNEKFAFIFKGLKSWSVEETRGRFSDVMQDLLEFRQDIYRELITYNDKNSIHKYPHLIPVIKPRASKINGSGSILPVFEDPRSYTVACEREQLTFVNDKDPFNWKVAPPRGLELMVPSVCFVIPFREKDIPGLTSGIEIQYKHLLSQWNIDTETSSGVKHQLTSSKVGSLLKVLKPILNDAKTISKDLVQIEENDLGEKLNELEKGVENVGNLEKTFDDIVFPDAIPMPGEAPRSRDMVNEPPCTEEKTNLYEKEPDMKFDDDTSVENPFINDTEKEVHLSPIPSKPVNKTDSNLETIDSDMKNNADQCKNMSRDMINEVSCLSSIDDLLYKLDKTLNDLNSHNEKSFNENSISQNVSNLHDLHRAFYSRLYPEYRNLIAESSQTESTEIKEKMKLLIERWKLTNFTLNEHSDRLNNAEVVIIYANKLDAFLTHAEWILVCQHGITANSEDIQKQYEQLVELSNQFDSSRNSLEKLQKLMGGLRDVELSEVGEIVNRWERALIQVNGRKKKLEEIQNKVLDFRKALTHEIQWLESVYRKLESEENLLETIKGGGPENKKIEMLLTELTDLDQKLIAHRKPIQSTFYKAESLILSSKAYENDLKEFSFVVNECIDESCRYFIADQSREWIASNTIKLSQLYEMILTELPQKINLVLSTLYQDDGDNVDNDKNNNELSLSIVYNGDNDVSFWELDKLSVWIQNKELEFSQNMPSYNSVEELNRYVSNLETLIDSIDKNENWVESTLNSVHNSLNLPSSSLSRTVRESIRLKTTALEIRWSKLQWDIEGCHARLIPLQKLILFYEKLLTPFQTWLEYVEKHSDSFDILSNSSFNDNKLQFDPDLSDFENVKELSLRHERFLNDVTHHVTDLNKLNRYGNMLITSAKDLQVFLSGFPDSISSGVDGTGQIWELERNLYGINGRYKTLVKDLKFHGEMINEFLQKLEDFSKKVASFLPWLNRVEHEVMSININDELSTEQINVFHEQILNFHSAIESRSEDIVLIKMASYYLSVWLNTGESDSPKSGIFGMWSSTTDSLVKRFNELYGNINQKRSQLQILFFTRPVCPDVVYDMLQWVENSHEEFLKLDQQRDKSFLYEQIKLIKMVSLEAQYRQASIEWLLEQRTTFGQTEDDEVVQTLLHVLQKLIDLRLLVVPKRESCFTTLTTNVKAFGKWLDGILHHLISMNIMLYDVESFEKEVLKAIDNLEHQRETFLLINLCEHELTPLDTEERTVNKLVANLNTTWREVAMELITKRAQSNEVLGFKQTYKETFYPLLHWLEKMEDCTKVMTPVSIHPHVLIDQLMEQKVLVNDAYSFDSSIEIHNELAESALYDILSKYLNDISKQPVPIEQEIRNVRDRYENILSYLEHRGVHLKLTYTRLEEYKAECDKLNDWLKQKAFPFINSSNQIPEDLDGIVKQYVQFLRFNGDLERLKPRIQNVLRLGREIVAGKTDVDGATFITKQNEKLQQKWDAFTNSYSIYEREMDISLEKTFHKRHKNISLSLKMMINEASDLSRTKDEAILVKSVRDLCLDITQYEPSLNTLYQAAELLTYRSKCDLGHINSLVSELDKSCKELDYILKNCEHFNSRISFDITSSDLKKNMKEKVDEELDNSTKSRVPVKSEASFKNPFLQDGDPVCLSNQWSWIGHSNIFSSRTSPQYSSYQSTVERHTRVARSHVCNKLHKTHKLVDYQNDPCSTFEDEKSPSMENVIDNGYSMPRCVSEQTVTSNDGTKVRKVTTTDITRQERKILRRRYYDAHGNECVEEIEIPDEKRNLEILDEEQWVDDGASVIKSPEENETTTEEKYIRDEDGNIIQWIVKKQIRRTKRTRIVKRLEANDEIDLDANSQISIVPNETDKLMTMSSNELLDGKSSMSIQLDKLIELYNARKKYVTFLKKNIRSIDDVKKLKEIDSRLLCHINGDDYDELRTIMRINPSFVHRLFVSRVVPSFDRLSGMPGISNINGQNMLNGKELMNLSASIQNPYLNDRKYYQGIKLKCIKSPSNEDQHICPEHNLIEMRETDKPEHINGLIDKSNPANSKRKGFRLIIQPSEKDSVVYDSVNHASFRVKPHSKGKLIIKDIISSYDGDNEKNKYAYNENILPNGVHSPSILLHDKDKSIKIQSWNSSKTHVKASLTKSSTDISKVAGNAPKTTISITVDADGNHDSVLKGDPELDGSYKKRFRKITVIPSSTSSKEPRDQNYTAKLKFKSNDIHAIVLKHHSKYPCKSETMTLQDVSYEETDIINESEIIEETTTHHRPPFSPSSSPSKSLTNKERISYSDTIVTKTETVDENDKTLVHIKVESKNERKWNKK